MPRPPSDSRELLLGATQRLLRSQGYFGTSIKAISKEAKAPIGSLYFLFPGGKDEIVVEALRRSGDAVRDGLAFMLANETTPTGVVRTYATLVRDILTGSGYVDGCPIATVALETAHHHDEIASTVAQAFQSWTDTVADALVRVGVKPTQAHPFAGLCLAAVEGALIVTRANRQPDAFDVVIEGLIAASTHRAPVPPKRVRKAR